MQIAKQIQIVKQMQIAKQVQIVKQSIIGLLTVVGSCLPGVASEPLAFESMRLTDAFYCEGATIGDFNKDGQNDVCSGPFIYYGPDFRMRSEIYPPKSVDPHGYSDVFLSFTGDINQDGWDDVVHIGFPGKENRVVCESQGLTEHADRRDARPLGPSCPVPGDR